MGDQDETPAQSLADTIRLARAAAEAGNIYPDSNPNAALHASLEVAVLPGDGASGAANGGPGAASVRPVVQAPVWIPLKQNRNRAGAAMTLSTAYFAEKALEAEHTVTMTVVGLIYVVVWSACCAMYVWEVLLYVNHSDQYCENNLPVWCLVAGVAGLTGLLLSVFKVGLLFEAPRRALGRRCGEPFHKAVEAFNSALTLFGLAWLIVGSVWTYRIGNYDNYSGAQCSDAVFLFCWYAITATWGFSAFMCFFGTIIYCCASFFQWRL